MILLLVLSWFFRLSLAYDGGISYLSYAFPGIDGDLTKITWEHRVNSKERLRQALAGDKDMIEADVSLGFRTGEAGGILKAIMAHPPDNSSDLTLEEFLNEALNSEKGIKLDFKSRAAFSASEYILAESLINADLSLPLIINADILNGPINCNKTPVDADYFLSTAVTKFPQSVLSLGWTTCYGVGNSNGSYKPSDIENMTTVLARNHIVGEVTFAVRAGLAVQSIDVLNRLIKSSVDATLTVWSSDKNDPVDVSKLSLLIKTIGKDKVLLDLTDNLKKQLDDLQSGSASLNFGILVFLLPLMNTFLTS